MIEFFFVLFSLIAIVAAILMVSHKNPVYSVMYLIVSFFCMAGLYFLLEAPFLGIVQIVVYAGAIMVLFLFVIMLLNLREEVLSIGNSYQVYFGIFVSILLLFQLGFFIWTGWSVVMENTSGRSDIIGSVENLGLLLFSKYLYPFEVASVLLLVAIIGAIILGRKKLPNEN